MPQLQLTSVTPTMKAGINNSRDANHFIGCFELPFMPLLHPGEYEK